MAASRRCCRIETTERAIRRFIERQGGPAGLSVCYEAGAGGFALWRLLTRLGVACDVVAPSLIPVRAGDRVKTDRRDAKKLVGLYRAGMLRFVHPPDGRAGGAPRSAAGRVMMCGARGWRPATGCSSSCCVTAGSSARARPRGRRLHRAWLARQRLDDPLAQEALEQLLIHLDGIERQLATLDARLGEIAGSERWASQVEILTRFRGISDADRARVDRRDRRLRPLLAIRASSRPGWGSPRASTPPAISSTVGTSPCPGNKHARRLLIEAAWHYRHAPRRPTSGPEPDERAWHAQVRLHHRHRHLTDHGKRSTVANVAVARELVGFLWAAMTDQPLRATDQSAVNRDQLQEAAA